MNNEFFHKKKILVIVPHEDDELNLMGGLLYNNEIDKNNLFVCYVTNGDYNCKIKTRVIESILSLRIAKIPSKNIIFLGYPDQSYKENTHLYMTKNETFISKHGQTETQCLKKYEDYSYKKTGKHSKLCMQALVNDIILLINDCMPDIVFVNDFDSHPDHRSTSLCFDYALGEILKLNKNYKPRIFKGFCYSTTYNGKIDYDNLNIISTSFLKEKHISFCYNNPFVLWEDRIRFPLNNNSTNYLLLFNKLYSSIKMYSSQMLITKYKSIINGDQVFWQRLTNNLSFSSNIEVSSGNKSFINDFVTFDCENIMHKDISLPKYKNVSWIPEKNDNKKFIKFTFDKKYKINYINFYQNSMSDGIVSKIKIKASNGYSNIFTLDNNFLSRILLDINEAVLWLKIEILSIECYDSGFSEIEIISYEEQKEFFLKLLIDDNFVYNKYYFDDKKINFSFYFYNGFESKYLKYDEVIIKINDKEVNFNNIYMNLTNNCKIKIILKKDTNIYDEVILVRQNKKVVYYFKIKKIINSIVYLIDLLYSKVINKIRKTLNFY